MVLYYLKILKIVAVKKRESKFGSTIVIETSPFSGKYLLGFQSDNMELILVELKKLSKVYLDKPILGVKIEINDSKPSLNELRVEQKEDDVEIIETNYNDDNNNALNYITDVEKKTV